MGVSFDTIGRHWGVSVQSCTDLMHKLILPNEFAVAKQGNRPSGYIIPQAFSN